MDNRTNVREDPLEDPRLDAGVERPEILAFQEALQILERVRGIVYVAAASTLERTVEFVQWIIPFYATTVRSPADVTLAHLANVGITPKPVSARGLYAFDTFLLNAVKLFMGGHPAAPGPFIDEELALPQDVVLTHPHDERRTLRVRAGTLGCGAVFQFAAGLDTFAELDAVWCGGHPRGRTAATLGALAARAEPGAACGVRRVSLFSGKPYVRTVEDAERMWLPEAVAQAAAVLEATRSMEVPFCVTNSVQWLAGYVAREEGRGVSCRYAPPMQIGENMLSLGWTATEKEQEASFRAVLALMCALIDKDVPLADIFA